MLNSKNYFSQLLSQEKLKKKVEIQTNKYILKNTYHIPEEILEGNDTTKYFLIDNSNLILTDSCSIDCCQVINTDSSSVEWEEYRRWISTQYKLLKEIISPDLNFSYELKQYKMVLSIDDKKIIQTHSASKAVAMNPITIFPLAIVQNSFYKEDLITKIKSFFEQPLQEELPSNKAIIFDANALAEIIRTYFRNFCCDMIYANQSAYCLNNLGTFILNKDITIISSPFDGIFFDSDGNFCERKRIIKEGKLVDFISNQKYSNLLNIDCVGNADFDDNMNIEIQRIELILNRSNQKVSTNSIRITAVENIYWDTQTNLYQATVKYTNNLKRFACLLSFSIEKLFDCIIPVSAPNWNKNVLCQDVCVANGIKSLL